MRPAPSSAAFLAGLLLLALAPPSRAAEGMDVLNMYSWRDSASGATVESLTFDAGAVDEHPAAGSAPLGPFDLGFTAGFPYYGQTYTRIWISENGWVGFKDPVGSDWPTAERVPDPFTGPGPMIAAFWTDCRANDTAAGHVIRHGRVAGWDAYAVRFVGNEEGPGGQAVAWDVILFADGHVKVQYAADMGIGGATIGIENADGLNGVEIAGGGNLADPSIRPVTGYVLEFMPPPELKSYCFTIPARGCNIYDGLLPGNGPGLAWYGCAPQRQDAGEDLLSFTLTEPGQVSLTLAGPAGLGIFLLDGCTEHRCVAATGRSIDAVLAAGKYVVAVDGPTTADEGPYTLTTSCAPAGPTTSCGDPWGSQTNAGGPSRWSDYPCAPGRVLDGPEAMYFIRLAAPTNLRAALSGAFLDLDVLILRASGGSIGPEDCIAWGDTSATARDLPPGDYVIVVDGLAGATDTYRLDVTCGLGLDCGDVQGTVDLGTGRVQTIHGDTSGEANGLSSYACDPAANMDGGEQLWRIDMPSAGQLTVSSSDRTRLSAFLLSTCSGTSCIDRSGMPACAWELPAGTYYLVVDSQAGREGSYDYTIAYEESFNRWLSCQDPQDPTLPTTTSALGWHFADHAFCITDPRSHNYPDGCGFAMYVATPCGSTLHFPMWDVEGGHVRVFDVLRGRYSQLTAVSSGGYYATGTDIRWQDPDCVDGGDPRWTNQTTDVFLTAPGEACGVFRLEFAFDHSGNVWDLYSNCSGIGTPGFLLHDNLCDALAEYRPLPEVWLVSASAVATCPDITVTYSVRNGGCAPARNFPVMLQDDLNPVYVDTVPEILPGQTLTRTFTATFGTVPTGTVQLAADPWNIFEECSEAAFAGCGIVSGTDTRPMPGCSAECQVVASAEATPSVICAGSTTTVDASSSSSSLCPGGILQYRLTGPSGPTAWQASAVFAGLAPAQATDYDVEVRCADPALQATCTNATTVHVDVDRAPDFSAATATDLAACNLGIGVTWTPATFHGPTGTGSYNLYRSTVSCADALAQPPIAAGLGGTGYTDITTAAGIAYYYVVEAEDGTGPSPCVPNGPRNGGAVARVAVTDGACAPVVDVVSSFPDTLPKVGGTLRVGGSLPGGIRRYSQTSVDMQWGTDRALDLTAGEHFHVLRSERPDGGFANLLVEPPALDTPATTDGACDDTVGNVGTHVWHYLIVTADACENDNRGVPGA